MTLQCHIIVQKSAYWHITHSWVFSTEHVHLYLPESDLCISSGRRAVHGWVGPSGKKYVHVEFSLKIGLFKGC